MNSLHIKSKDDGSPISDDSTAAQLSNRADKKVIFSTRFGLKNNLGDDSTTHSILSNRWGAPENIFSPRIITNVKRPKSIIKLISPGPTEFISVPTELVKPTPSVAMASTETVRARPTGRDDPFNAVSSSSLVSRSSEDGINEAGECKREGFREDETVPTIGTHAASTMHVSPDEATTVTYYKEQKKITLDLPEIIRRTMSYDEFMTRALK